MLCVFTYINIIFLCLALAYPTFSSFMNHTRLVRKVFLLDVQFAFTVSPTLYSARRPEIHGYSSIDLNYYYYYG